jgi:protein TonB
MNERNKNSLALPLAFFCSLLLHVALIIATSWSESMNQPARPPQTALLARLAPPLPPQPELTLPAATESPPAPPPPESTAKTTPDAPTRPRRVPEAAPEVTPDAPVASPLARLTASARQQLGSLDFYPLEAIQNGWQGEAWVQIFLDENGNVIAARLEASSGYPLLDDAAVNAARRLRSLSHNGLDSAILPVRFKLE